MCENNDYNIIVFVTSKTLMLCCNKLVNFDVQNLHEFLFLMSFTVFFVFFFCCVIAGDIVDGSCD